VVDDTTGLSETDVLEGEELTIEDVLLPKQNQGADLAGEVTKKDVVDPDDPEHHEPPDTAYKQRLMTLAGMNNGF